MRSRRPPAPAPDAWVAADDGAALAVWVREPVAGGGAQAPTVVLSHGWTLAAPVWAGVVDALRERAPGARLVVHDQRGHGASSARGTAPPGRASIARLGDDLAAVVARTAPTGPLVLVGHSMGGMALLSATGRHPDLLGPRTCGVVLLSTAAGGLRPSGRPLAPLMAALARLPQGVRVPRAPGVLLRRSTYGPGADPALVTATSRALGRPSGRAAGEWFGAVMAHDEVAALPALAAAATRVRVLVGAADRLTPVRHAQALAAALPGARLRVVPGCGHMLLVERPDVVAEEVAALLPPP